MSYTDLVWSVVAATVALTVLCVSRFQRRLSKVGLLISFCVFAVIGLMPILLVEVIYSSCLASDSCLKKTGDDEYSFLIPIFAYPVYWLVFVIAQHIRRTSNARQ